jgi:hypothetical protein
MRESVCMCVLVCLKKENVWEKCGQNMFVKILTYTLNMHKNEYFTHLLTYTFFTHIFHSQFSHTVFTDTQRYIS